MPSTEQGILAKSKEKNSPNESSQRQVITTGRVVKDFAYYITFISLAEIVNYMFILCINLNINY